jgi:hypothetical protein
MANVRLAFCGMMILVFTFGGTAAVLRGPMVNGNGVVFGLDCEANAIYLIERSTNLANWSVVVRNDELTTNRSISFSNEASLAFYRARRTNEPVLRFAMAARRGIDLNGQNVRTDSFDSGDFGYNDGFGHYTNTTGKWKAGGDIVCNDLFTNFNNIGNANIYGKVSTGPYGPPEIGSAGMIGDLAWQTNPANKGKIQPGWATTNSGVHFPTVVVPSNSWFAITRQSFTDTNGIVYDFYFNGTGTNHNYVLFPATDFRGKIYVEGTVRLLVQYPSKIVLSGADRIQLANNARLELYADCPTASFGGLGVLNDGISAQFYYFGTDHNTSLSYGGNAAFTGVIYAPNAALTLGGGGNAQVDISGSIVARSIKLNGNFTFHYDQNLQRAGPWR